MIDRSIMDKILYVNSCFDKGTYSRKAKSMGNPTNKNAKLNAFVFIVKLSFLR